MDFFKKHVDTMIVLGGILSSIIWMNGKFSELEKDIYELKKDMAIIKTVLIMKGIMPEALATAINVDQA